MDGGVAMLVLVLDSLLYEAEDLIKPGGGVWVGQRERGNGGMVHLMREMAGVMGRSSPGVPTPPSQPLLALLYIVSRLFLLHI